MKRIGIIVLAAMLFSLGGSAQGVVLSDRIRTIKLHKPGDQTAFPLIPLGSIGDLELHFDDLDNQVKQYYYTFQLCNADWTPSMLRTFEYITGFQNVRITNYRNSSLATTRYIHYQATLPDRNCYPKRSGNYLLKVFLDNDTSKVVFTRKMVVVDNKASIAAVIQQPFNADLFRTGQKLSVTVQTDTRIQVMSPNDLKLVILQNNNWQSSVYIDRPTIFRGNYYEYTDEQYTALPAAKEFRWIDLRSLRLKSDRMQELNNRGDTVKVDVKPDPNRNGQAYVYYRDLNGVYTIETLESNNPFWQGDYSLVNFSYFPPGNRPFPNKDVYLFGEFTNYGADTTGRMVFNPDRGAYERTLFLKQGFYNYLYATQPAGRAAFPDFSDIEGNYYGTENSYTVLVYFRPFGARADELIGYTLLNSQFQR